MMARLDRHVNVGAKYIVFIARFAVRVACIKKPSAYWPMSCLVDR